MASHVAERNTPREQNIPEDVAKFSFLRNKEMIFVKNGKIWLFHGSSDTRMSN